MQQPKPTIVKGVDVTLRVLDPNNNCYDGGTTTSNDYGSFKMLFAPEVPGEYYVYATFAGSDSYYGSSALTAINVEEAPAPTAEPTPIPASAADLYFLPMSIGTIIAIIVVGLLLFLLLRKKLTNNTIYIPPLFLWVKPSLAYKKWTERALDESK